MSNINQKLFIEANKHIPGGVNSPVRAFKSVGGTPIFFKKAKGAYLYDEEDNQYIDYVGSWGAAILGHNHPDVVESLKKQLKFGISFGTPTVLETKLADLLAEIIPNLDLVRMVNSGTEATMSAIRLARGYTKRDKIIKFEGCYHGHSDSLLVKAGSGALTLGKPSSPGIPASLAEHTIALDYNNIEQLQQAFKIYNKEIACVIVEPIAGNMNLVPANKEFLSQLRQLCDSTNTILIFDEVMSGFRVALGGAQEYFGIEADLLTYGKVMGGGMPIGAFGGKKNIMEHIAPLGPVYQAGTLSGNPMTMASGIATIEILKNDKNFHYNLTDKTNKLATGMMELSKKYKFDFTTSSIGGMFGYFFNPNQKINSFKETMQSNSKLFNEFFHNMLSENIYFAPSMFEAGFMSIAHSAVDIQKTLLAVDRTFAKIAK